MNNAIAAAFGVVASAYFGIMIGDTDLFPLETVTGFLRVLFLIFCICLISIGCFIRAAYNDRLLRKAIPIVGKGSTAFYSGLLLTAIAFVAIGVEHSSDMSFRFPRKIVLLIVVALMWWLSLGLILRLRSK